MKYLEPLYAESELASWAQEKFGIDDRRPRRCSLDDGGATSRKPADEIVELIEKRAREAYAAARSSIPIDHVLTFAFGGEDAARTDNPYAADYIRALGAGEVRRRAAARAHPQHCRVRKLRDELIGYQEQFLRTASSRRRSTS